MSVAASEGGEQSIFCGEGVWNMKLVIDSMDKTERLQDGLDKLGEWSEIWQLNLSINKCLTLHVGEQNPMSSHCVRGLQLANVIETVDLGILVDTRLRFDIPSPFPSPCPSLLPYPSPFPFFPFPSLFHFHSPSL